MEPLHLTAKSIPCLLRVPSEMLAAGAGLRRAAKAFDVAVRRQSLERARRAFDATDSDGNRRTGQLDATDAPAA